MYPYDLGQGQIKGALIKSLYEIFVPKCGSNFSKKIIMVAKVCVARMGAMGMQKVHYKKSAPMYTGTSHIYGF